MTFKKKYPYRLIAISLFFLISIAALFILKSFPYKNKASESAESTRWTLDQIAGKEIKGDKLIQKITEEDGLREDISIIKSLETEDLTKSIQKSTTFQSSYKSRFGIDLNKVFDVASPSGVPLPGSSIPKPQLDIQLKADPTTDADAQVKGVSTSYGAPTVGSRSLPTVDGVNVDTFTGLNTMTYPINIPSVLGNIPITIGLTYSSRSIDEQRLNKPGLKEKNNPVGLGWGFDPRKTQVWEERIFKDTSSPLGIGWNLSSIGSITLDPDRDDEFMLSFAGKNIRIKWDKTANTYKTTPDNKIKLERVGNLGAWKVTDTGGTVYLFGSIENERHTDGSVEPARSGGGFQHLMLSKMSANEYTVKTQRGSEGTLHCSNDHILSWHLSKISDIHGNTAEIDYEQEILTMLGYAGTYSKCQYTTNINIKTIKYNYSETARKYLTTINFGYQDSQGVGNPYYDMFWTNSHYQNEYQAIYSPIMVNNKILTSIVSYNNDQIVSRYDFTYTKSYKNPNIKFGCPEVPEDMQEKYRDGEYKDYCAREEVGTGEKARQLLLTKITYKGFEGKGVQRPYTFCYKSLRDDTSELCNGADTNTVKTNVTPNDIYLSKFDNGYGGIITYEYEKMEKIDRICTNWRRMNYNGLDKDWRKICTDVNGYVSIEMSKSNYTSYYRIKKLISDNGQGQQKATEYQYDGTSQAYATNIEKKDGLGYSPIVGLQFLGVPKVRIKVKDNKTGKLLSNVEQLTDLFLETGPSSSTLANEQSVTNACFMVDPRRGMIKESNILNESGVKIGSTNTSIIVKPGPEPQCLLPDLSDKGLWDLTDASKGWKIFETYNKSSLSQIDGKKSKTETIYDFEAYPNDTRRNFGNVVKSINYGNPDIGGDEVYTYTTYLQDNLNKDPAPYFQKNLINLVLETIQSDVNLDNANVGLNLGRIPEPKRYEWKRTYYDERLADWGYQQGVSGVRGLPSSALSFIIGKSADAPNEKFIITSKTDYDKYGLPIKQTAQNGAVTSTYYDDTYHQIPLCTVQWKVTGSDPLLSQPKEQACDISNNKDKKIVSSRSFYDSPTSLARGLADRTSDPNGAQSKYEYDEYGRVTKSYQPDKDTGLPETTYLSQSFYYDDQSPMRTRTRTRRNTDTKEVYQTIDTFFDGFGNKTQTILYDQEDNQGKYALLSVDYINGIGQVVGQAQGAPYGPPVVVVVLMGREKKS